MTTTTLATGILAIAGLAVLVFLVASANRKRRAIEDVPPAMRPGYSDEQLETTVIERYMAWGLILTLFFAVFFPLYYLREHQRLNAGLQGFFVESVVRGEVEYRNLCAECHGPAGQGGAAPSPEGGAWPAPNLVNLVARYADNPNVDSTNIDGFIRVTLERGRPGTPMPAWGAAHGGPLNDQQIDDLVNWILANQIEDATEATAASDQDGEQLFMGNCAKCHGADLQGGVAPPLHDVFQRHNEATILAILRNGIVVPTGAIMPPWQNGYMYSGARYTDEALQRIVDYLAARQQGAHGAGAADEQAEPVAAEA